MNDQKIDENTRKTNANAKLRDFIAVPFIFIGLLFLTLAMITGSTYTINKVLNPNQDV